MTRSQFAPFGLLLVVACSLIGTGCAHDTYQERANLIKDHADAFYDNLKANRVDLRSAKMSRLKRWQARWETTSENGEANKAPQRSNGSLP